MKETSLSHEFTAGDEEPPLFMALFLPVVLLQ